MHDDSVESLRLQRRRALLLLLITFSLRQLLAVAHRIEAFSEGARDRAVILSLVALPPLMAALYWHNTISTRIQQNPLARQELTQGSAELRRLRSLVYGFCATFAYVMVLSASSPISHLAPMALAQLGMLLAIAPPIAAYLVLERRRPGERPSPSPAAPLTPEQP